MLLATWYYLRGWLFWRSKLSQLHFEQNLGCADSAYQVFGAPCNQNSCHALIMCLPSCSHSNSPMASAYIPRLGLSVPVRSAAKKLGYQQPTIRAGGSSHEVCRWKGCLYFFVYRECEEWQFYKYFAPF